jgi:hypothetical protein
MQPRSDAPYRSVVWAADFDAAVARAHAEEKPILLVLAAGERDGPC